MQDKLTKVLLLACLFVSSLTAALAQGAGTIQGIITDAKTQEGVIGGTVHLDNTTIAGPTDVKGFYQLLKVPAGQYTLVISSVSYKSTSQPITVTAGKTTVLNGKLAADNKQLDEVVVSGVRRTNTEVSVINEMRQANVVVSGISSEQIVKTQDRDAAEVVRRIPGVTIVDNRFIQIRGLSDRYNTVWLNDVTAPSSETDRKSFLSTLCPARSSTGCWCLKTPRPSCPATLPAAW